MTPQVVQTAVIVKAAQGMSNREIARDLDISHPTVGRILKRSECTQILAEAHSRACTLAKDANDAIEYTLTEKKDGWLGVKLLEGLGVLKQKDPSMSVSINFGELPNPLGTEPSEAHQSEPETA